MASFRDSIGTMATRAASWPKTATDPIALPRAVRQIERRFLGSASIGLESEQEFLGRVVTHPPSSLLPKDQRRGVAPAWRMLDQEGTIDAEWVLGLTRSLLQLARRSSDRAIVTAWLDVFPRCEGSQVLASAAREAAQRHDWTYRSAGETYNLWDPVKGPRTLGRELLSSADLSAVLQAAGISPGRFTTRFVQAALASVSDEIAETSGPMAENACGSLLDLFERFGTVGVLSETQPRVVRALLRPWLNAQPSNELKARIQKHLVATVGDPRTNQTRWLGIEAALRDSGDVEDAEKLRLILKRWLVTASFEIFFRIMGRTTDNRIQWAAREKFWRKYLEKGHVQEAWFILGYDAEQQARAYREELAEAGGFGRFTDGANPGHSALLMQIGNVVVGEWTHDGSCCFWQSNAAKRPPLYARSYDGHYLRNSQNMRDEANYQARKLGSAPLWEAHPHRGDWPTRFATVIRRLTGIRV